MGLTPPPGPIPEPQLVETMSPNWVTTRLDFLANWARASSLWPMPFGTACCAIEYMATAASRFDIARFGMERQSFSPRQADVLICAGRLPYKLAPVIRRIWDQMPEPKWCIAMGACASSGGMYRSYAVLQGIDQLLPVDVYISGCPPRPEALIEQIEAGASCLKIHEDWGATPAAIRCCLSVADDHDIQVMLHSDSLNESGFVESTVAALAGRTIHAFHTEGSGGGHAPDIIKLASLPNVLPSSNNTTRPFTINTIDEHLDMLMIAHHLDPRIPEDLAFAELNPDARKSIVKRLEFLRLAVGAVDRQLHDLRMARRAPDLDVALGAVDLPQQVGAPGHAAAVMD